MHSILYVDDDADIREVVAATLTIIGKFAVRAAGSGERAIALARESKPDLVLMDVMIPGLDGPSILKLLRESPETADIPVIFMTAKVMPAEIAHLLRLGALGVIRKPFDPMTLCGELSALWKQAKPAGGAGADPGDARAVQSTVDPLAESFLRRTAADAAALARLIESGQNGDRSTFAEIAHLTHSIHGTGAVFGYSRLSEAAGEMERLTPGLAAQGPGVLTSGEAAVLSELRDGLAHLNQALAQAEPIARRPAGPRLAAPRQG